MHIPRRILHLIEMIGESILRHPDNDRLIVGILEPTAYWRQVLAAVYRVAMMARVQGSPCGPSFLLAFCHETRNLYIDHKSVALLTRYLLRTRGHDIGGRRCSPDHEGPREDSRRVGRTGATRGLSRSRSRPYTTDRLFIVVTRTCRRHGQETRWKLLHTSTSCRRTSAIVAGSSYRKPRKRRKRNRCSSLGGRGGGRSCPSA